jgi:hypothetical protein
LVIKPLGEDSTPGTVKPVPVSLVEPVAYQFQLVEIPTHPSCGLAKLKIEIADALRAVGQFERPKETAQSVLAADFKTIELEIE